MLWSRLVSALPSLGGLDPEAEPADLDGLVVQVHAVEVVLQDVPVEVEKRAACPQLLQPVIRSADTRRGAARTPRSGTRRCRRPGRAARIGAELVLPGVPEADAAPVRWRRVERVEVVGPRVGEHTAGRALGLLGVLAAEGLEAVAQDAAEGLLDDVAGDEGGRVERPFLLAAAGVLGPARAARSARPARCGGFSRSVIDCSKMWPRISTSTSLASPLARRPPRAAGR